MSCRTFNLCAAPSWPDIENIVLTDDVCLESNGTFRVEMHMHTNAFTVGLILEGLDFPERGGSSS